MDMDSETTQEQSLRESDSAMEINEKADMIVDILTGQKLKQVRMILGRVEDKIGELFLLN